MLGLDVAGLDVPAFLAQARLIYALLALIWLALLVRLKSPAWLLAGVLLANAYAWAVTNYPLQRLYALGPSHDRVANLGLVQVVAAGNPPLQTTQVGQLHFEPFWGVFVAFLSWWNPTRVLAIYPFLPLVMAVAFALALYVGLGGGPEPWPPWPRALAAAFVTLLSSSPFDYSGTYRVPWALMFLLKPNHALGLVLFPLLLRAFVSIRTWRGRLGVGLLLHLLGWVFVLHMVYVSFGLVVFAALSLLLRRPESRRDLGDVVTVIGINLLVVSPYLYMLVAGYPFMDPGPRMAIPPWSAHLLETTTRTFWLFPLGLWGLRVIHARGDRLARVWTAQVAGAFVLWAAFFPLSALQLARERDEVYFWLRFLMSASAGLGAWDLAQRAFAWLRPADDSPALRAAAVMLIVLPWTVPYWWDPLRMDAYFAGSIPPVPAALRAPMDFLREHTEPQAVVAGDHRVASYVSALGARRVLMTDGLHLPRDYAVRMDLEERLLRRASAEDVREAETRYGVRYLLVTPSEVAARPGLTLAAIQAQPLLQTVHVASQRDGQYFAILRLKSSTSRAGER